MTALSLELIMDITRDWVSSFVMLCQAFTAADFSCCLWVFLPLVLSSTSEIMLRLRSGWDQEIDLAIAEYSSFYLQKLLDCFCCMFWVIVHLYYEAASINFAAFGWIWAASIYSTLNISEFIQLESVILLAGCCERVFLYHREVSRSSPPVVPPLTSRPFYVAELTSAFFFFSECTKLLIWPVLMFLLSLDGYVLFLKSTIVCFTCMESSFDCMMWVHSNSFQMQWHTYTPFPSAGTRSSQSQCFCRFLVGSTGEPFKNRLLFHRLESQYRARSYFTEYVSCFVSLARPRSTKHNSCSRVHQRHADRSIDRHTTH